MKTLLAWITLFSAASGPLRATNYYFGDYTFLLADSNGAWLDSSQFTLGKFVDGFIPNSSNFDDWSSHWISDSAGYFDGSSPEWSASLTLADNNTFAVGDSLLIWAFTHLSGTDRQWALLSDPAWKIVVNSPLDLTDQSLEFSGNTVADFGRIDLQNNFVQTGAAGGALPVPEPATWIGVTGMFGFALACGYRRRARALGLNATITPFDGIN